MSNDNNPLRINNEETDLILRTNSWHVACFPGTFNCSIIPNRSVNCMLI